jgi:uracil-DNA glycosylase
MAEKIVIDLEDVKSKLYDSLKESGWHNVLKGFLLSEDFDKVILALKEQVEDDKRFTPPLKQVFRAFQECPLDSLQVIVVGQDPYPQMGVADGISFSCSNTMKKEASLRYIHGAVSKTVYDNKVQAKDLSADLTPWANQGVLMLNTSLTTEIGKIGKHFNIWQDFTAYVFDMVSAMDKQLIWVFLGKKAEEYAELVDDKHVKLVASHPASAAYQKQQEWDCNDVFNKINKHISENNGKIIAW